MGSQSCAVVKQMTYDKIYMYQMHYRPTCSHMSTIHNETMTDVLHNSYVTTLCEPSLTLTNFDYATTMVLVVPKYSLSLSLSLSLSIYIYIYIYRSNIYNLYISYILA